MKLYEWIFINYNREIPRTIDCFLFLFLPPLAIRSPVPIVRPRAVAEAELSSRRSSFLLPPPLASPYLLLLQIYRGSLGGASWNFQR